jgi:predicted dehydrogenase
MVNLALIGCGYWGPNYVRVFNEIDDSNLIYIADVDHAKLTKLTKNSSIKVTKDYKEILADDKVDAVVISTPSTTHYEIAKNCLLKGRHVLVEKPMTLSSKESEELIKIADSKKKVLMVGHTFMFNPAVQKLKEYIKDGTLGDVYYISLVRTGLGPVRKDVNAMWDLAPHDVSILNYLLDTTPNRVSAIGGDYIRENIEDVVFINLTFESKILANIHASWLNPHKVREVTVVGSKKMAVFDDVAATDKIKLFDKGVQKEYAYASYGEFQLKLRSGDILIPDIKMSEPLKNQCLHFIDCVKNNKKPITDGRNGLEVVKVLEAAQESLKNGGREVSI